MAQRNRIMYVEAKEQGVAYIGRVAYSRTYQTIHYRGKSFQRSHGGGIEGNFYDVETGEEYWISGCKHDGGDRHYTRCTIHIDDDVREEYWTQIRNLPEKVNQTTIK